MEIELGANLVRSDVCNNRVTGIVSSSTSGADVHVLGENVGELACKKKR